VKIEEEEEEEEEAIWALAHVIIYFDNDFGSTWCDFTVMGYVLDLNGGGPQRKKPVDLIKLSEFQLWVLPYGPYLE
jgi:hypothetical protein